MQTALAILGYALLIGVLIVGLGAISVFVGIFLARAAKTDEPHH
jgi:hypothetical protein